MAREFEINPRQVKERGLKLPDTSAMAQFSQAFGNLATLAGEISVNAAVEKAAIAGAQERLEGKTREKLAPGITQATASFNKAYETMDSNIIYAETKSQLDRVKSEMLAPGAFDPATAGPNYKQTADAIIAGGIGSALEKNKNSLAFELKMHAANNELAIADYGRTYAYKQAQKITEATRESLLKDITNAAQAGYKEEFFENVERYNQEVQSAVTSGYMTQPEADLLIAEMENGAVEAYFKGEGSRDAIAGPGVVEARKQELANELDSYTPEQVDIALKSYTAGASLRQSMMQSQQAINKADAEFQIKSGAITNDEQLSAYRNQVSALDYWSLKSSLLSQQQKAAKELGGVNAFRENAALDNGFQNAATSKVKNSALSQDIETFREQKLEQSKGQDASVTPQDMAKIVASYKTNVPMWDSVQESGILSGNFAQALPYLQGYSYQKNVSPRSIGLKGDAQAIADAFYQKQPAVENAAQEYDSIYNAVRKKDDIIVKDRVRHFDHGIKEGAKQKTFRDQMGVDAAANPDAYSIWKDMARENFASLGKDYTEQNFQSASDQLGNRWQKSRYGKEDELQLNPLEAVSDQFRYGNLGDNYINAVVYQAIQRNKALPEDQRIGQKIEWPYKAPFPVDASERELVSKNLMYELAYKEEKTNIYEFDYFNTERKPEVFLNGERAEVVIVTGGFTVSGELPVGKLYLKTKSGDTVPWWDSRQPQGIAQVTMRPADEIIPNIISNASDKSITDLAQNIAEAKVAGPKESLMAKIMGLSATLGSVGPNPAKIEGMKKSAGHRKDKDKVSQQFKKELATLQAKREAARSQREGPSDVKLDAKLEELSNG